MYETECLPVLSEPRLIPVKMGDDSVGAFNAAVAQGPKVITNSWGYNVDSMTSAPLQGGGPEPLQLSEGSYAAVPAAAKAEAASSAEQARFRAQPAL